ncbi:MAG: vanadium-dependent haloperoxidase [Lysobacteraceae bacterium]
MKPPAPAQRRLMHCLLILSLFAPAAQAAESGTSDMAMSPAKPLHAMLPVEDQSDVSLAYRWLDIAQEATVGEVNANGPRPTVIARTMAIWATAMYDAWAAYDLSAVGSRLGGELRRPAEEHTLANKQKAISYAAYRSLLFVYPESAAYLTTEMRRLGYDPDDLSTDAATPQGVGNLAAQAVIDYRRHDGANQLGDEEGSDGKPYSDYTYYRPVNPPDRIIDPDRWQPITFTLADGRQVTPGFLTPHWYRVTPFLLESSAQFRPPPPPTMLTDEPELRRQTDAVLNYNATLTKEQKALVEFMRDGPRSTGQSGHWLRFAQDVSRRDHYNLDQDVKLYFVVANVAFDAFIACWETKRYYDSSRPWTLIHHYYKGKTIIGWAGPEGGTTEMLGEEWHPYSPQTFVTPPFPGYTSGHATVSGAAAKIIELFTGTDEYGYAESRAHCALTENEAGEMVTMDLPTWSHHPKFISAGRHTLGIHIPIGASTPLGSRLR